MDMLRVYTHNMSGTVCHCMLLRRAARRVSKRYDDALEPLGINIAQFSFLRNVERMAPVSLTDLGARLELDRSTVGRNAKVLERMGLVASTLGKDQREAVLVLTESGMDVIQRGVVLWDAVQDEIEGRLSPAGIGQLRELLAVL